VPAIHGTKLPHLWEVSVGGRSGIFFHIILRLSHSFPSFSSKPKEAEFFCVAPRELILSFFPTSVGKYSIKIQLLPYYSIPIFVFMFQFQLYLLILFMLQGRGQNSLLVFKLIHNFIIMVLISLCSDFVIKIPVQQYARKIKSWPS
ncbi:hypothetical protein ACJX0J_037904, partial [Zea mays]